MRSSLCVMLKQKENILNDEPEFVNPMNFVGQYHNAGLDYILKKYPYYACNNKSYQDTIKQISTLLNDFRTTIPQGSPLNNSAIDYKTIGENISKKFIDNKGDELKSAESKLSEKQRSYIDQLRKLLKDQNGDDSVAVFAKVSRLEKEIWKSNMTDDDKYRTLSVIAVGKYSWKYWAIDKELNANNASLVDTLIEADIIGGIAGAVIGCFAGAVEGTFVMPGAGSVTGCILQGVVDAFEGAVVSSVVTAIIYLLL